MYSLFHFEMLTVTIFMHSFSGMNIFSADAKKKKIYILVIHNIHFYFKYGHRYVNIHN